MRKRQWFVIGNKRSDTDFGIYISGNGRWVGAEPDVEPISIPGRNGDLTLFNNRWHNVSVQYDCFILKDFKDKFSEFRAYLQSDPGYRYLGDSYSVVNGNITEYRMARVDGYLNINDISWLEDAGSFTVRFNCMPQRFLTSGMTEEEYGHQDEITNDTLFTSKPLWRIPANSGGGTIQLVQSAETYAEIAVGNHEYDIFIDCETQDAYDGVGDSVNNLVTMTDDVFPDLKPGQTQMHLSFSDPSMKIYVTPRWFTL